MVTTEDIDKRQICRAVFIDLKKAFDTIYYKLHIFSLSHHHEFSRGFWAFQKQFSRAILKIVANW